MGIIFYNNKERFWNGDSKSFKLQEIKDFLITEKIAMYDTARRVIRLKDNASDKFLEIIEPVDITKILVENISIKAVVSTGEKACSVVAAQLDVDIPKVGECKISEIAGRQVSVYRMPSSSRAYPLHIEKKADYYSAMFKALGYDV